MIADACAAMSLMTIEWSRESSQRGGSAAARDGRGASARGAGKESTTAADRARAAAASSAQAFRTPALTRSHGSCTTTLFEPSRDVWHEADEDDGGSEEAKSSKTSPVVEEAEDPM
mmetsp:Transcript_64399/g.179045  ORF Transcript_64399/g.179045 Transcript_64399/m.179045 type:complete len:116 (+) Transcript_64399:258-605(+)